MLNYRNFAKDSLERIIVEGFKVLSVLCLLILAHNVKNSKPKTIVEGLTLPNLILAILALTLFTILNRLQLYFHQQQRRRNREDYMQSHRATNFLRN